MLDRFTQGQLPDKHHKVFRKDGAMLFEHCFTRDGFDGPYSILYHREAPTAQVEVSALDAPWPRPVAAGGPALLRHHYTSSKIPAGGYARPVPHPSHL